ncbi:F-box/LRR-repeat protein 6 [Solea solea]|uniref:F-box/LRR-repeat protein 6 n=1 Tax=Solea solea TaxID=90069 RepID=UPI0027297E73|nr:F-box/LRR-repeat protein 6 [Solea solea]XP_058475665.1 F-box/LRR-repeat protein 6 [Solea solea]XP_058475666.1 F-box/LRR-repeat protein 6 [Solea solea]XP_058475667.1 F-box/LRR-repeat protein 6 [Solea solea]
MMNSPEAESSTHSESNDKAAPSTSNVSGQEGNGPKSEKSPLKRKSAGPKNAKTQKHKKARVSRSAQLGYTVHQGEDMLLVISNASSQYDGSVWKTQKRRIKKKTVVKGKVKSTQVKKLKTVRAKPKPAHNPVTKTEEDTAAFVPQKPVDHRWGQSLPEEVLVNIFNMVVIQDGAVPFLCRVGRVCRLWNAAASSPVLWRKVCVSHCWIASGKKQLPKTEKKIKETFDWLAQNRFSQLRDFSLCHWSKNANYAVEVVSQSCPHLRSLKLSYCTGLTAGAFQILGQHSSSLQSINLQYSEFQVEGLLEYLENHGRQIKQILFTHALKNDRLLAALSRGCCPDLELLEVNTKLDSKNCELSICIHALQMACPKLKTFRMLNVRPLHKTVRSGADSTSGFPLLEELCIATTSYSYMTDKDLLDILFSSTRLRVLDLRGCSRITPPGLATLPCPELECLFWGQYFSSHIGLPSPKKGLHMVTQKWSQTLQQLDIANQLFSEEDLEIAMRNLAEATEVDKLRSLNLSGTRITPPALRSVVGQMTALNYLNLSSCRYLPRGVKRIYRGQEDIRQLLDKLE